MADNFSKMNPLYGVYSDFQKILDTIVIKYNYLAEKYETFDIKKEADMYIACKEGLDTFFTYSDYTIDEFYAVGITDASKISLYSIDDGYLQIPASYRDALLKIRRKSIIQNYEEKNEYYRKLNGFPPLTVSPKQYHYISQEYAERYGIDINIPIHKIQDHYNNISSGRGDYLISIIEGLGILDRLKEQYPNDEYLNFIGSKRIDIVTARKAKNFQLLYIHQNSTSNILYEEFVKAYEQARDYHVSAIFIREYRDIIPYYDQFIALCIMTMTLELVVNKQFKLGIDREYYNDHTLKLLYDSYGIPYNMDIDEYTQRSLAQSINMLIQNKSTDRVFTDITKILGFDQLKIYRYYLTKERKFDEYGVPIIATSKKFNNDTGEIEDIPDYSKMYDVYFQKVELTDTDFVNAYNNAANMANYEEITNNDPFWWDDENTYKAVWETEYNFVEAKYLSVGLSYKMTEIMYESVLLLKLLVSTKDELNSITFTLPKIDENLTVNLFDAIILLFCLMSKKHNLRGEIISIPTQVTSVLDYLHNTDGGDEFLIDSFSFDLDLLQPDNPEGQEMISRIKAILGEDDAEKFMSYITSLSIDKDLDNNSKITIINNIFANIKGLSNFLQYLMTKTSDRKTYETLKEFYNASFYSKEVKSIFTINENNPEMKRTAKNYFEFLYYYNPKLYSTLFMPNYEEQYSEYLNNNNLTATEYTLEKFIYDVEYGNIDDFDYSTLKSISTEDDSDSTTEKVYYYIDHIISRMETYISNLKFIYMINDTTTSLTDLLVKLINFFKSFTVDMLGLDIMYIMDLRAENTMKLLVEIKSMMKDLGITEDFKLSYKDILHLIDAFIDTSNDTMSFNDKALYDATITIGKDSNGSPFNLLKLAEMIKYIELNYIVTPTSSDNMMSFVDIIRKNINITLSDKTKSNNLFTDRVVASYYSE